MSSFCRSTSSIEKVDTIQKSGVTVGESSAGVENEFWTMPGLHFPSVVLSSPERKAALLPDELVMGEEEEVARHGRVYKKSNWTLAELQVLQTAKREDQMKQMKADSKERHKSAAERWQWIEDYCWEHKVERSAQQCRDRWERMSADYKKVLDFEKQESRAAGSYWQMTIEDRKLKKLPSNFQNDIYNALGSWFVRSRPLDLPDAAALEACFRSPLHEHAVAAAAAACPPDIAEISTSIGDDKYPLREHGQSIPAASAGQKRKWCHLCNADHIAAAIDRACQSSRETMLECEDRKDRRHKEILDSNERMANGYTLALINIADALRQIASSRKDDA